jgi:hypothetical protein
VCSYRLFLSSTIIEDYIEVIEVFSLGDYSPYEVIIHANNSTGFEYGCIREGFQYLLNIIISKVNLLLSKVLRPQVHGGGVW